MCLSFPEVPAADDTAPDVIAPDDTGVGAAEKSITLVHRTRARAARISLVFVVIEGTLVFGSQYQSIVLTTEN